MSDLVQTIETFRAYAANEEPRIVGGALRQAAEWVGQNNRRSMVLCQLNPITTATSRWYCRLHDAKHGEGIGYGESEDEAAREALRQAANG